MISKTQFITLYWHFPTYTDGGSRCNEYNPLCHRIQYCILRFRFLSLWQLARMDINDGDHVTICDADTYACVGFAGQQGSGKEEQEEEEAGFRVVGWEYATEGKAKER